MRRFAARIATLLRDTRGAMVVEFALLAPAFLVMVFGVMYVGMGLQNYTAIRNLSADVARHAMVQQQNGNVLTNTQIRSYALSRARGAPYLLNVGRMNALVTTPTTQRITGVREVRVVITYEVDNMLAFAGIPAPFFTYTRPVFLSAT
jgi:Flp pilus assembly protein TadG